MVSYGVVRDTLIHPCPTSLAEPDGFPAFHVTVYYPISRSKYFRVLLQLFGPPLKWWTFNIIYGVQLLGSIWIPPPVQSSTGVFTTPINVSSNYRIWCWELILFRQHPTLQLPWDQLQLFLHWNIYKSWSQRTYLMRVFIKSWSVSGSWVDLVGRTQQHSLQSEITGTLAFTAYCIIAVTMKEKHARPLISLTASQCLAAKQNISHAD